jgi:adenosylmethionine-8-amino-7-oxononanoate aminotransferase
MRTLQDLPMVGDVRGSHLMVCVECVIDKKAKTVPPADWEVGLRIWRHAMPEGLLIRPLSHLVILSPPLIINKTQVDMAVASLRKAIRATADDLIREGLWQG